MHETKILQSVNQKSESETHEEGALVTVLTALALQEVDSAAYTASFLCSVAGHIVFEPDIYGVQVSIQFWPLSPGADLTYSLHELHRSLYSLPPRRPPAFYVLPTTGL